MYSQPTNNFNLVIKDKTFFQLFIYFYCTFTQIIFAITKFVIKKKF